ncbi:MAG: AraC family transcriptional regulator [Sphaerochaetaceae bacterium]
MNYSRFIEKLLVLTEEERNYEKLWKEGNLPKFPSFIGHEGASFLDVTLGEDIYFPSDEKRDIKVEKHARFLPSYLHDHVFLEMAVVLNGSCSQEVHGRNFSMEKGDILIIAPQSYHAISVFDEQSIILNILVRHDSLEKILKMFCEGSSSLSQFFSSILEESPIAPCLLVQKAENVFPCVAELAEEGRRSNLLAITLLQQFIARLFLLDETHFHFVSQGEKSNRLAAILHYINENPREVTLSSLADAFNLSPTYLSALIHDSTGTTFSDLLLRKKMEVALACLSSEIPMTCTQIAQRIGYGSAQHFCRTFKKCYGISPMELRNLQGR